MADKISKSNDRIGGGDRGGDREGGTVKRSFHRGRGCRFCGEPGLKIDYKDPITLRPFLTERFKLVPRRISGNCAACQRKMALAVKRARHLAFVPYSSSQIEVK